MDSKEFGTMLDRTTLRMDLLDLWNALEKEYDVVFPDGVFDTKQDYDVLGSIAAKLVETRRALKKVEDETEIEGGAI